MQSINALSLAPAARDWLANSRHPRILHIFDHACNLINERRETLSLVTRQIGNGPFNLVIEDDVLFSDCLNARLPISIRANQLHLGDLTVNTFNAKLWPSRPDWKRLHAKRDLIFGRLKSCLGSGKPNKFESLRRAEALRCIEQAALARTGEILPITVANYQLSITQSPIPNSLVSALANAEVPSSLTAARGLAGLGQGLTPAGDDFILGAVLAAWIIHPEDVASVLAKEITEAAAPLTTSLSAAWLRAAGKGEAGILWHQFFAALISVDRLAVQKSMKSLLAVGHTSGADAFAGFAGMFAHRAALTSAENCSLPS